MAWPLLSVSGCYCLRLSQIQLQLHVSRTPITRNHPSQSLFSGNRIRTRFNLLNAQTNGEQLIEDLRVPQQWLQPSKALEDKIHCGNLSLLTRCMLTISSGDFAESEWLQSALNKWLDDEYCPEETNIEISKVAATSFYRSLLENKTDIGEILLKMAGDLESISYQESFHGAFSSANAAVNLIIQRLEQN